ncbi:hydroxypyruvate isomerase family protein [Burkholderia sp. Leaf177]|uniref:hydroxypyruvate isomerase family protein n=1 Tax=Burkholderia sp. Leaf177 TaxID=1736287 RepID=UPI001F22D227|nr:TIM barrel protein [Burkholderia sp. Leaf177]
MNEAHANVRFAANLKWLFTELPFTERFEVAAKNGFAAVEYASPYAYDLVSLRDALKQWDLTQVLINTPVPGSAEVGANGYACIPGCTDMFRDGVEQALDYADALGCNLVHLMAGKVPVECTMPEADAVFIDNLAWAARRSEGTNVTFVLECLNQHDVPGYFLRSLAQASAIIRQMPQGKVKLLFDFYHAGMSGLDVLEAFALYREDIAHIQVADVPGRYEPGTGGLPWNDIAQAIANSGYGGWIGCEYLPRSTTIEGLGWRRDFEQAAT